MEIEQNYVDEFLTTFFGILGKATHRPTHKQLISFGTGEGKLVVYLLHHPEGVSSGELGKVLDVGSGRTANALKNLEKKGVIKRKADPKDNRRVLVTLTVKGRRISEERQKEIRKRATTILTEIGKEKANLFLKLLDEFANISHRLEKEEQQDAETI